MFQFQIQKMTLRSLYRIWHCWRPSLSWCSPFPCHSLAYIISQYPLVLLLWFFFGSSFFDQIPSVGSWHFPGCCSQPSALLDPLSLHEHFTPRAWSQFTAQIGPWCPALYSISCMLNRKHSIIYAGGSGHIPLSAQLMGNGPLVCLL